MSEREITESLRGIATSIPRIELVMRQSLEVARTAAATAERIAENTVVLPRLVDLLEQLLDVLVVKRTNGHTDLHASNDAEGEHQ